MTSGNEILTLLRGLYTNLPRVIGQREMYEAIHGEKMQNFEKVTVGPTETCMMCHMVLSEIFERSANSRKVRR